MNRPSLLRHLVVAVLWISLTGPVMAGKDAPPASLPELERWGFLAGSWDLKSTRYSFEGEAIEENSGTARFAWTMKGLRLQELQSTTLAGREMEVLNIFMFHPERREWELARTDSLHHAFNVLRGEESDGAIVFFARNPSPNSDLSRRWTYKKISNDRFSLLLEFSEDQGKTWFRRNETFYTRR